MWFKRKWLNSQEFNTIELKLIELSTRIEFLERKLETLDINMRLYQQKFKQKFKLEAEDKTENSKKESVFLSPDGNII